MYYRAAAALLCFSAFISIPAYSQAPPPNPTQRGVNTSQEPVATFRVTVVGRSTPAVNYRPRSGDTLIDFAGTTLAPRARGRAEISGEKGYIEIDAKFDRLDPAGKYGPEYLTYVLWAVTPEGRATNLGELQINGDDGQLEVTTELQSFALIVTAEPYFGVTQPSDVVVMENVIRKGGFESTDGRIETLQAKYELLKRGSYLMNQNAANLRLETPKPGARSDLAQARNAVTFARIAGADRYAPDTYDKAVRLLAEAEQQSERRRSGNSVQQPARQAVQTAEDARLIALQKQEEEFQARLRALAEQREADARAAALAEADRRVQAERDRAAAEAARAAAQRETAAAEAARLAAERERQDAERQRLDADRVRAEAERARLAAEKARADADAARAAAEAQAQQARAAADAQSAQARAALEQAERDKAELRDRLRQQLNVILETRETARGLIVNLSDVLFDVDSANLKAGTREKLARIAGILSAHPGLQIEIEGHTDSTGSDEYNQRLSERRAQSVQSYLNQQGIGQAIVATAGYGESRPVATNGTAVGRQQNRRVELVVSGEAIGRQR